MVIPFREYIQVKDNYYINYLGSDSEKVKELINFKTLTEKTYPGIKVYLILKKEMGEGEGIIHTAPPLMAASNKI